MPTARRGDDASRVATALAELRARRPGLFDSALVPGLDRLALDALSDSGHIGDDRLRLDRAPLVPEVGLLLAEDAILLWARLEADAGHPLPAPFWASPWPGGQALARYVLDHPETVAGARVLDIASGSGLVAIAAALAGAAAVTANDIDPYAVAIIGVNAVVNGVDLIRSPVDLLDGDSDVGEIDVVLAGDALYESAVAAQLLPFLNRVVARGGRVLVGDPDRGHLPHDWLEPVVTYQLPAGGVPEDSPLGRTSVLQPRDASRGRSGAGIRAAGAC